MEQVTRGKIISYIDTVKQEFFQRFGLELECIYDTSKATIADTPNLDELKLIANTLLSGYFLVNKEEGIESKSRQNELVVCRQLFCYLAMKYGYNAAVTARHIGFDRTTALHNYQTADRLLEVKDKILCDAYMQMMLKINALMRSKRKNQGHAA